MSKLLEECLLLGDQISSKHDDKGMARIGISWNPYECHWRAYVDWSDSSKIEAFDGKAFTALRKLKSALNRAIKAQ